MGSISVTNLAGHHDVGGALDAVGQGFTAAVQVVELGLGDGVVHVDGREEQLAFLFHLIEAMHAGGGFFGNAAHLFGHAVPAGGIVLQREGDAFHDDALFLAGRSTVEHGRIVFRFHALVDEKRGVAAVVHDEVGAGTVGPGEGHFRAPPVIFQRFTLPGEDLGHALFRNGCGGMILRGEDVAGGPADVGAEFVQRADEHGRLYGHVQRTADFQALEGLFVAVAADEFHKARHFAFGKLDFLLAEVGKSDVGYFVVYRHV